MSSILYLASKSQSRQLLLTQAKIPFKIIEQHASETISDKTVTLAETVKQIAKQKMEHAILPHGSQHETIFVLTADTLVEDSAGRIHGKPIDYQDTVSKIKAIRGESKISTGYCVEKKVYLNNNWNTVKQVTGSVESSCIIDIPDNWIERYIENTSAQSVAGGIVIDEYGMQFVKSIHGSYTGIIGLPLYELRIVLEDLGFFSVS